MKKKIIIILGIAVILFLGYFFGSGFVKNPTVIVTDYSISQDEKEMTINTSIASSMGYIRKAKTKRHGNYVNVDFYYAFGGINGKIGAKSTYTLPLENVYEISVYTGNGHYEPVLRKNDDGTWKLIKYN